LIKTLLAIEDKRFYEHSGISLPSIFRAFLVNLKAGQRVQGGSTITQQLVKNYFLSNDKSYWRKVNEALMSLMLEWHYSKDEIIEAYLNEIYLGQEGKHAIHGFGLASWFYFAKPVTELNPPEIAILVALVKGASYYDPRRSAKRALERRNLVLTVMQDNSLIDQAKLSAYMQSGLGVIGKKQKGITSYPAFVELVKQQLADDYDEEDLRTAGLRIFSTLDPHIQRQVELTANERLNKLENTKTIDNGKLETAIIVTKRHSAEVQAVVGGRHAGFSGFNRAIGIKRSIGSLVKPAIYLEALSRSDEYYLGSLLNDEAIEVDLGGGQKWVPNNYDNEFHGAVPLYRALANSYNLATVQLGLSLGLDKVNARINSLGVSRPLSEYPANLLGAIELSPFEVTQMFQTLADGGYLTPLRTIRSVTNAHGEPLQHYAIKTQKVVDDASAFLINLALQNVVQTGTAKGLSTQLEQELYLAGKTGTTNDKRDSWFAGFSQQYVSVAWVGHDDFTPTVFTGASGAMKVWGDIMQKLETKPLVIPKPEDVIFVSIDPDTGLHVSSSCRSGIDIPINANTFIGEEAPCRDSGLIDRTQQWLKQLF
ncbi:MAG: penicillin-binding protein 1B, partial [Gammaproteobacteria bacterium]|nr:penicillin-binding protein 1B [Gammaproteobacteria bacterium]